MIRRIIITAAEIICCYLLQCSVFEYLAIAGILPNLLIILTAATGFIRGPKEGLLTGFFCGLLLDIMSGNALGFYTMIYLFAGYLNGFFKHSFYPENIKLPVGSVILTDFFVNVVIYIASFLIRGKFAFGYYLFHIIFPELVYTALVALVLYPVILKINQRLEAIEKRSAAKFV